MDSVSFLQDLAVVMMVAGLVTLLFHRLKQPVVLGYLLAGFIIGPFTPPFPLIRDAETIQIMADLGVVFLMFYLGLDFNLRKLRRVGPSVFLLALFEILVMTLCGYLLGSLFGWSRMESLLLGIMLALTSTMIVVKGLRDRGELRLPHAELISGTCLFEDIFVIMVMIMLPGFARTGSLPAFELGLLLAGLFIFLVAAVIIGLLVVPRLLRYISRHASDETLLVVSLGLCFGLSLFALKLQFSAALGAFLIGAVVAESREAGRVTILMGPLRDMFCAVFFVAIGMQIDPAALAGSLLPAVLITVVYLVAKIGACSLGAFLTGADPKTSMRVGTNMAQIGEFAFILAALAGHLGLIGDRLYPLIVSVASLNAFVRPYFVENSDRIVGMVVRVLPETWVAFLSFFRRTVRLRDSNARRSAMRHVWSLAFQLVLNLALISGGFIALAYVYRTFPELFGFLPFDGSDQAGLIWLATAVLLLPLYIATIRKMQAMSMMLAELMTNNTQAKRAQRFLRSGLYGSLFFIQIVLVALLTLVVSATLLPPWQTLTIMLIVIALLVFLYGRAFNRWYTGGKFALLSTFNEAMPEETPVLRPMPAQLSDAGMESVTVAEGPLAGQLIRELQLRTLTGASIVALERGGKPMVNPGPDMELQAGDILLLIGDRDQLAAAKAVFE